MFVYTSNVTAHIKLKNDLFFFRFEFELLQVIRVYARYVLPIEVAIRVPIPKIKIV